MNWQVGTAGSNPLAPTIPNNSREGSRHGAAEAMGAPVRAPNANAYAERVIETIRAECLDPSLIQRSRPSRSDARDVHHPLQPRAATSRSRLCAASGERRGPATCTRSRCAASRPARWPQTRIPRTRCMIESGFLTPTGRSLGYRHTATVHPSGSDSQAIDAPVWDCHNPAAVVKVSKGRLDSRPGVPNSSILRWRWER